MDFESSKTVFIGKSQIRWNISMLKRNSQLRVEEILVFFYQKFHLIKL